MIPLQNLTIGIIFALVEWIITKDFNLAVAMSGLMAGGTYDLVKNINQAYQEFQQNKETTNTNKTSQEEQKNQELK